MVQVWAEPGELAIVEIIADVLKKRLNKKIITKDDLFTTDNAVLEKLEGANNKKINDLCRISCYYL